LSSRAGSKLGELAELFFIFLKVALSISKTILDNIGLKRCFSDLEDTPCGGLELEEKYGRAKCNELSV